MHSSRRDFFKQAGQLSAGLSLFAALPATPALAAPDKLFFEISLAQWSLNKSLFGGKMTNLDFPVKAKKDFGISIVEYVNQFFKDKAKDTTYLKELMKRCNDNGVRNHLIMIDGEGNLGDTDKAKRTKAVENHYRWVDAAKFLGCKTIRVNAAGEGTAEEVKKAAIDGLRSLSEFAAKQNINVIVENHGGYSSDGSWLSSVMKGVNLKNCGTLPDFGNFCLQSGKDGCTKEYDRYKGTKELMPFAKGVSAKSHEFDDKGNEVRTDYNRMLKIVKDAGFKGIIGVEYEGTRHSEDEGIRKTKALLEKVGGTLS
jgi:sugar phosphate isomerase/epimerase